MRNLTALTPTSDRASSGGAAGNVAPVIVVDNFRIKAMRALRDGETNSTTTINLLTPAHERPKLHINCWAAAVAMQLFGQGLSLLNDIRYADVVIAAHANARNLDWLDSWRVSRLKQALVSLTARVSPDAVQAAYRQLPDSLQTEDSDTVRRSYRTQLEYLLERLSIICELSGAGRRARDLFFEAVERKKITGRCSVVSIGLCYTHSSIYKFLYQIYSLSSSNVYKIADECVCFNAFVVSCLIVRSYSPLHLVRNYWNISLSMAISHRWRRL